MTIDPKRVKEIFLEAAELPDESARARSNACRLILMTLSARSISSRRWRTARSPDGMALALFTCSGGLFPGALVKFFDHR